MSKAMQAAVGCGLGPEQAPHTEIQVCTRLSPEPCLQAPRLKQAMRTHKARSEATCLILRSTALGTLPSSGIQRASQGSSGTLRCFDESPTLGQEDLTVGAECLHVPPYTEPDARNEPQAPCEKNQKLNSTPEALQRAAKGYLPR